jgi:uncharacterized protein
MEPIYIPHIARAPEQTYKIPVQEPKLLDLETLTPVQGTIQVRHGGNFLEIKAQAEAIMTLTCDRCLQQYNHRLSINASELIWLQEVPDEPDEPMVEREVALDDLVESLSPQGHFRPDEWRRRWIGGGLLWSLLRTNWADNRTCCSSWKNHEFQRRI